MKLTLLGTGCPSVSVDRYGPAALVQGGAGANLLFDCGSGVTQRLLAAGCPGRDVDGLLITHLHSDHIVDLFQLVISSWHQGRDRPHRIFGPPGTNQMVRRVMEVWRPELEQRQAHECRPSTAGLEVEATEFAHGSQFGFGALTVTCIQVNHRPVRHAFGFKVESDGGGTTTSLFISGDTTECGALDEAASGVHMLLHEVFIHREMKVVEGRRSQETIDNVASYHTLSSVVGKVAARARAGTLVLTHFVPPRFDETALTREVAGDFSGRLVIGRDLMALDVATGRILESALAQG